MSTVMKQRVGPVTPSPTKSLQTHKQVQHDRWPAIVVLALMAALMGFIIWLASQGGGVEPEGIYFWPMMP